MVAAPWLSRRWRRAAWAVLVMTGAARLITGGLLPMQLVLALAAGVTAGAGMLVVLGAPDRRMGPAGVAAALRAGGLPVGRVTELASGAKGSRPFQAVTGDERGLFVGKITRLRPARRGPALPGLARHPAARRRRYRASVLAVQGGRA